MLEFRKNELNFVTPEKIYILKKGILFYQKRDLLHKEKSTDNLIELKEKSSHFAMGQQKVDVFFDRCYRKSNAIPFSPQNNKLRFLMVRKLCSVDIFKKLFEIY